MGPINIFSSTFTIQSPEKNENLLQIYLCYYNFQVYCIILIVYYAVDKRDLWPRNFHLKIVILMASILNLICTIFLSYALDIGYYLKEMHIVKYLEYYKEISRLYA